MQMEFGVDSRQLESLRKVFRETPGKATTAAMRVVNRAIDTGRTITIRQLVSNLGIKRKDLTTPHRWGQRGGLRPAVRVVKATKATLSGRITIESGRIPLIYFNPRPGRVGQGLRTQKPILVRYKGKTFIAKRRGTGVSWSMGRFGSKHVPMAFLGRGRRGSSDGADVAESGHVGVFIRKRGAQRLPIHQLMGPSVGEAALKDGELRRALETEIPATIEKRLDYELGQILAGAQ